MKYLNKVVKKCVAVALLAVMIASVWMVEPVQAKVTMPAKSEKLVKNVSDFGTMLVVYEPQKSWTKVTLNNDTCFRALVPILYDCEGKYAFSSAKEINKACYKYFGKNGYKDVTTGGYFYYFEDQIMSNAGDWGLSAPTCKITKKKKVKSGVYDVYVTNSMKDGETGKVTKAGESVIRIKKNTKSAFGYVVTGIKYKTTNKSYLEIY